MINLLNHVHSWVSYQIMYIRGYLLEYILKDLSMIITCSLSFVKIIFLVRELWKILLGNLPWRDRKLCHFKCYKSNKLTNGFKMIILKKQMNSTFIYQNFVVLVSTIYLSFWRWPSHTICVYSNDLMNRCQFCIYMNYSFSFLLFNMIFCLGKIIPSILNAYRIMYMKCDKPICLNFWKSFIIVSVIIKVLYIIDVLFIRRKFGVT